MHIYPYFTCCLLSSNFTNSRFWFYVDPTSPTHLIAIHQGTAATLFKFCKVATPPPVDAPQMCCTPNCQNRRQFPFPPISKSATTAHREYTFKRWICEDLSNSLWIMIFDFLYTVLLSPIQDTWLIQDWALYLQLRHRQWILSEWFLWFTFKMLYLLKTPPACPPSLCSRTVLCICRLSRDIKQTINWDLLKLIYASVIDVMIFSQAL